MIEILVAKDGRLGEANLLFRANKGIRSFLTSLVDPVKIGKWQIGRAYSTNRCTLTMVVKAGLVSAEL